MILISACLAGVCCRYDGGHNAKEAIRQIAADGKALLVCPEQLGGLPTPRTPAEIVGGSGEDVIAGRARVVDRNGRDVTAAFIRGAEEVLGMARLVGAKKAILKESSPSCGGRKIYDGTFTGAKKAGVGVTAALLAKNGIQVLSEENFGDALGSAPFPIP